MRQLYSFCGPAALRPVPSEIPLSTHLPTLEGWTAEMAAGLWLAESVTGFESTWVYPTRFETLRLIHSAKPPSNYSILQCPLSILFPKSINKHPRNDLSFSAQQFYVDSWFSERKLSNITERIITNADAETTGSWFSCKWSNRAVFVLNWDVKAKRHFFLRKSEWHFPEQNWFFYFWWIIFLTESPLPTVYKVIWEWNDRRRTPEHNVLQIMYNFMLAPPSSLHLNICSGILVLCQSVRRWGCCSSS